MNWTNEKEEWLLDWEDARCLKEVAFEDAGSTRWPRPGSEDNLDVFFSDTIEACGRCLVCRASGSTVNIFDVSPTAQSLVSWRVELPSPILPDIGIAYARDEDGTSLSILFLTKAHVIHALRVLLRQATPDMLLDGSTACSLPSPPSSFCALDRDFVAIGCFNGTLHAVRLGHRQAMYEFTDMSLVQRIVTGCFLHPAPPLVSALAFIGPSRATVLASGFWLLSFSADGKLRLWEASRHRGVLIASRDSLASSQDGMVSMLGSSPAYMRVSPSRTRACLVLRSTVLVIDLPADGSVDGFAVREVQPPFPAASPSLVALSHSTLWSFWSGQAREQLFHLDLEEQDLQVWHAKALDASLAEGAPTTLQRMATEGCSGRPTEVASHRSVFTLHHQHEVWRAEEDGFDPCQAAELLEELRQQQGGPAERGGLGLAANDSFGGDVGAEDSVLQWWLHRIFLPGRFSDSIVAAAVAEAGGRVPPGAGAGGARQLRGVVEELLRRQAALHAGQGKDFSASPHLQLVAAVGSVANEFLHVCSSVWTRRHQVCGMGTSCVWGSHAWHPAGVVTAGASLAGTTSACPLLLCHSGVACVRPVHTWAERWWATLHLTRELSNHEAIEIEDVLKLSALDEWKLCATAWFLSQCVGNSGMGLALSMLRSGSLPLRSMRRFAGDVPQGLAGHLSRCARCMTAPAVGSQLAALRQLVQLACCPQERRVAVAGGFLDPTSGVWSGGRAASGTGSLAVCLSDILRGSIAVCESEYLCAAMRDLLLLCMYAVPDQTSGDVEMVRDPWPADAEDPSWTGLAKVLEEQLPLFLTLHHSMRLGLGSSEAHIAVRACDLWASVYRTQVDEGCLGLRPPPASFKSFHYAMQLLRYECWDAIRWWSRHQHLKEFSAYLGGRQWFAMGCYDSALEAFIHAENVANIVMECLCTAGLQSALPDDSPDVVSYYVHLAELYSSRKGPVKDEYVFLQKAAHLAEELSHSGSADRSLCQQLWSAAFEKAVGLEKWDEAQDALLRIDAFERCLHLLAQKLRSKGRIGLMLKLPEKHRSFFIDSLHEQASLSTPTLGLDSLACYQSLYALHFSSQQYLKAAVVAHSMYSALGKALQRFMQPEPAADGAQASIVPELMQAAPLHGPSPMDVVDEAGADTSVVDRVWPLLEQQRSALLMLVSALTLTPERLLLLPGPGGAMGTNGGFGSTQPGTGTADSAAASALRQVGLKVSPSEIKGFKQWFSEVEVQGRHLVFTLADAERLLAVTEAKMILSGKTGSQAPSQIAHSVATLGLLGLALQVAQACRLDSWQFAFQPFLRLCMDSEKCSDDAVMALTDAARGPTQAFMFAQADGCEPLGVEGSARRGLWRMLEECLRAASGGSEAPEGHGLDASGARLYSLAADEILSSQQPAGSLPRFITRALAEGPSWVCLLRLYMKHRRLEDAVDLVGQQLQACRPQREPFEWSPLQDFPVQLVVQLQRCLVQKADTEKSDQASQSVLALDEILAQFQRMLKDAERNPQLRQ